ncbi:YihY/virulence factor BrkB family protein [Porphyromonas catoniae]|uniref:YihY/virulence factor BrkB family protein n=1 Tax=Porphyromonas catoniae TaxID=41976 RepID=UPI0023F517DA|nr:YihY/virulence factor BrkB family protein [Porphyromonas catoniae]
MASLLRKAETLYLRLYRFITLDMWLLSRDRLSLPLRFSVATLRVLYMTVSAYLKEGIGMLASSLSYSTVLSIVPMLAVIVGIAKGFGLQNDVRIALNNALPGHQVELDKTFAYVENYLQQVQGGLFIGVGLALLFYTVLMLISTIEDTFNRLWQAPHARPWTRRIINYLGAFVLFPLLLTISSGTTLFLSTLNHTYLSELKIISTLTSEILGLLPYVLIIFTFTVIYLLIPNVRVRFVPALIAGIVAGLSFQAFQALYINGVLWISRYNAIYGSFAAVPLALLWIQLSWIIVLLGAQISYAIQHVWHLNSPPTSVRLSRRYMDVILVVVTARIVQQFVSDSGVPYRAETLAKDCDLPLRQTQEALAQLLTMGVIVEVSYGREEVEGGYYHPNVAPEKLTLSYLLNAIDRLGSEAIPLHLEGVHQQAWVVRSQAYEKLFHSAQDTLLRDLK